MVTFNNASDYRANQSINQSVNFYKNNNNNNNNNHTYKAPYAKLQRRYSGLSDRSHFEDH